jgi:hypothetical protein
MAQQDVIYPAAPLIIVDRQWRRNRKDLSDQPTFSINRPSSKKDVTISVLNKAGPNPKAGARPCTQFAVKNSKFEFVTGYDPSQPQQRKSQFRSRVRRKERPPIAPDVSISNYIEDESTTDKSSDSKSSDAASSLSFSPVITNSSTSFYGYGSHPVHVNAQELLHYCMSFPPY